MTRHNGVVLAAVLLAGFPLPARAAQPEAQQIEFFENRVRPVLIERCYGCHSTDAKTLRGGLLLDSRQGWMRGGDSGPVIEPGDPDASLLIQAIRYDELGPQMPPTGKLPDAEVAVLTEWVARGAPDPRDQAEVPLGATPIDFEAAREFWAFQPLKAGAPPEVKEAAWCQNAIDRFILARLEAEGLTPSAPADRRTLLRRAYLDVIGLPPTPEQAEVFVGDSSPDAFDRVLDRLLADPRYGERWARHWNDLARFAESHGFEHDYDRESAYPYRDFVIRAFNLDLPYDTFVKWQLAGDELESDNHLALAATGFLAAGVHSTQITKNEVEKHRYDELDDIVATIGTSMLGLTIGCARCHDHKYDPIPQRDYYRLLSTFTTTVRSEIDLDLDPQGYAEAKAAFDREHAPYVAALERFEAEELPVRFVQWALAHAEALRDPQWITLDLKSVDSKAGANLTVLDDGSTLAGGPNANSDTYTLVAPTHLQGITAVRLEVLAHDSLPKSGPGRADDGRFVVTDLRINIAPEGKDGEPKSVVLRAVAPVGQAVPDAQAAGRQAQPDLRPDAQAAGPQAPPDQSPGDGGGAAIEAALDGDPKTGWTAGGEGRERQSAVFVTEGPIGSESGSVLTVVLQSGADDQRTLGRFRLAVTTRPLASPPPDGRGRDGVGGIEAIGVPEHVAATLKLDNSDPTVAQHAALLKWYRTLDPRWQQLKQALDDHQATAPKRQLVKALISSEGLPALKLHTQGADFFEQTYFLRRGDPNLKEGVATQSFLRVLMTASDEQTHWQAQAPEGARTSFRRAAMADWITDERHGAGHLLARVIVNRLWQHHFGRGIVATSSDFGARGEAPSHPALLDWLAAELIRAGWRLKPIHKLIMQSAAYQQSSQFRESCARVDSENRFLWRHQRRRLEAEAIRDAILAVSGSLDTTMYGPGTLDPDRDRRSIYFTVKRSKLVPEMQLFDAPDGLQGLGDRPTTTTAPQALWLLNNANVRRYAEGFSRRIEAQAGPSLEETVEWGYRIALGRPPRDQELGDAVRFLEQQTRAYESDGKQPAAASLARTDFCQVLLGLNEFIYIE